MITLSGTRCNSKYYLNYRQQYRYYSSFRKYFIVFSHLIFNKINQELERNGSTSKVQRPFDKKETKQTSRKFQQKKSSLNSIKTKQQIMLNYVTIFFATKNKNNEILYFLKFTTFRILDRSPFYIVKVSSFIVVTVHTVIRNQSFVTSIDNTSKLFCCAFVCQHSSRNIDTLFNIRHSLENSFSMDSAILFATK